MSEEFKIGGTVVEVLEVIDYDENYKPLEIETIDIIKPEPLRKYVDEADMSGAPSIKDAKPAKKTKVKYDPHMKVMAPQVEKEDADLEKMQKDADANRARAAKLKDRNVTRGSASFAAAKVADDVKKAARTGPQQHKGTRTGVMRVEEVELDEYASMSPQEVMLQKKKAQLDVMIAKKRKQTISKAGQKSDEPTKTESVNEEESDAMKDRHLQRAGMGARADYKKPPKNVRSAAMSMQKDKNQEKHHREHLILKINH